MAAMVVLAVVVVMVVVVMLVVVAAAMVVVRGGAHSQKHKLHRVHSLLYMSTVPCLRGVGGRGGGGTGGGTALSEVCTFQRILFIPLVQKINKGASPLTTSLEWTPLVIYM